MSLTNLIKQDYYINYKGPNLTVANIWKKGQEKEDITDHIKTFYGENNNWNQKLYTYGEILPNKNNLYHFYVYIHLSFLKLVNIVGYMVS